MVDISEAKIPMESDPDRVWISKDKSEISLVEKEGSVSYIDEAWVCEALVAQHLHYMRQMREMANSMLDVKIDGMGKNKCLKKGLPKISEFGSKLLEALKKLLSKSYRSFLESPKPPSGT